LVPVRAGDIPDTAGPPSRLIVPGMDGFDPSLVSGAGRAPAKMPGQFPGGYDAPPKPGSEKAAGEEFAPFRPPSAYQAGATLMQEDDQMSLLRLRQRAGSWYDLSPLFAKLMRSGFTPDDIFDESGIEPKEQSLWITWAASRGSLVDDPRFPEEKLAYFNDEYNGAPTLSSIQYLVAEKRSAAAEFVVDNEFDQEQTKELVKAFEIRDAHQSQAKGFGSTPGECMAFKMWRDCQEVQRYQVGGPSGRGKALKGKEAPAERKGGKHAACRHQPFPCDAYIPRTSPLSSHLFVSIPPHRRAWRK